MSVDPKHILVETMQSQAVLWAGVQAPNPVSVRQLAPLVGVWEGFRDLRGELAFSDEPSDFESALLACRETD